MNTDNHSLKYILLDIFNKANITPVQEDILLHGRIVSVCQNIITESEAFNKLVKATSRNPRKLCLIGIISSLLQKEI